jgi:IS30 family transposase
MDTRKGVNAVKAKEEKKTSELVSSAVVHRLSPLAAKVYTLTFNNSNEFMGHSLIDQNLNRTAYIPEPFTSWERRCNEKFN